MKFQYTESDDDGSLQKAEGEAVVLWDSQTASSPELRIPPGAELWCPSHVRRHLPEISISHSCCSNGPATAVPLLHMPSEVFGGVHLCLERCVNFIESNRSFEKLLRPNRRLEEAILKQTERLKVNSAGNISFTLLLLITTPLFSCSCQGYRFHSEGLRASSQWTQGHEAGISENV
eukprot:757947-Hanusia_phi.AAC.7